MGFIGFCRVCRVYKIAGFIGFPGSSVQGDAHWMKKKLGSYGDGLRHEGSYTQYLKVVTWALNMVPNLL